VKRNREIAQESILCKQNQQSHFPALL